MTQWPFSCLLIPWHKDGFSLLFLCVSLMHHSRYSGPSGQRTHRLLTQARLNEEHFFYPSVGILMSQKRTSPCFNRKSLSELQMIKLFKQILPHNLNKETVILAMIVLVLPTPRYPMKGVLILLAQFLFLKTLDC